MYSKHNNCFKYVPHEELNVFITLLTFCKLDAPNCVLSTIFIATFKNKQAIIFNVQNEAFIKEFLKKFINSSKSTILQ